MFKKCKKYQHVRLKNADLSKYVRLLQDQMIKAPTSNFLILAYYSFNFPHIKILINCCSHSLHHNDVSTPVIRALSQRESWAQMIWTLWSLTPTGASTSWTVSWRSSEWGSRSTSRRLWSSWSWRIRKRWREPWFLPWSTAERTWDSSRRRRCVIHSLDLLKLTIFF